MLGGATHTIDADLIARAIVAAARSYGDDPVRAFQAERGPSRRCVQPAIDGLVSVTGGRSSLRRLFGAARNGNRSRAELAGGDAYRRAREAAAEVAQWELRRRAEAMGRGLPCAPVLVVTFEDLVEDYYVRPDGIAELQAALEANAVRLPAPVAVERPARPLTPSPYSPAHPKLPPAPAPLRPVRHLDARRKAPRGAAVERRADGVEVIRLQPITPDKLRRIRAQVENGLDLNEAADLFSLDVDQLERALKAAGWRP